MQTLTTTPFGARPVTACLLENQARGLDVAPFAKVDKWDVLNALSVIAPDQGLGGRTISVLQVLLTFHPDRDLADGKPMVVFASNNAICKRAHNMPESTLRRHISALVNAGLILRHDSPNGKRYARRDQGGQITRAFGFDLRPLLVRSADLMARAAEELARQDRIQALREEVTLMLRDCAKLIPYAQGIERSQHWDALDDQTQLGRRYLRRKLTEAQLKTLHSNIETLLADIHARIGVENPMSKPVETTPETAQLSGKPHQNERHYQSSNKDLTDKNPPKLEQVLQSCPDINAYFESPPRNWTEYITSVCRIAPMTGIDPNSWALACRNMGPENAATTVATIVQRIGVIANPGAYFRVLSKKAEERNYSPQPMLNVLSRQMAAC